MNFFFETDCYGPHSRFELCEEFNQSAVHHTCPMFRCPFAKYPRFTGIHVLPSHSQLICNIKVLRYHRYQPGRLSLNEMHALKTCEQRCYGFAKQVLTIVFEIKIAWKSQTRSVHKHCVPVKSQPKSSIARIPCFFGHNCFVCKYNKPFNNNNRMVNWFTITFSFPCIFWLY